MKSISYILILFVLNACNLSDEIIKINADWQIYYEGKHNVIAEGRMKGRYYVIPCEVVKYCHDENFIIVMQNPQRECFLQIDTIDYKYGLNKVYYWIVLNKSGKLLGPMNIEELNRTRKLYKIPDQLKLETVFEVIRYELRQIQSTKIPC
ncbi:hypothetical protein DYBT9275_03123 [Dyadobacter sp. CECT 9275]|uniref:Uncharacterized protein n=1 Tax=Dyadobacter helix TaxID=2822344 RepID=A0A916JDW5_9BACT|nr:hypothetical protein DYBT9275_03123 [Dyadobacter sp. CECT 9275]